MRRAALTKSSTWDDRCRRTCAKKPRRRFRRARVVAETRNGEEVRPSRIIATNCYFIDALRYWSARDERGELSMNKGVALIGGVGLGAALMYMFDPDRGKRRRALVQDKVTAAEHKAEELAGKMTRDVRNRIYGTAAEIKSLFSREEVSDDILVARVRSKLGRHPVHDGALNVTANNGIITLRGPVLNDELPRVLRSVRFVRGVRGIDNRLEVHAEPGSISGLQGTAQPASAS